MLTRHTTTLLEFEALGTDRPTHRLFPAAVANERGSFRTSATGAKFEDAHLTIPGHTERAAARSTGGMVDREDASRRARWTF